MRRFLPELIALPLLPLLIAQGKYTRHVTPRLPEAGGSTSGIAGAEYGRETLSLVAIGESPVAGVGVETYNHAITARLAHALATQLQRPVAWQACGKNGVTAREALEAVLPSVPPQPVDLAFVAFGVNDTTAFRPAEQWRQDLRQLLAAIETRCTPKCILLSGVPAVGRFPALPQPLRWVMGLKAAALDAVARELANDRPCTCYVPLSLDPYHKEVLAPDGYHPSLQGCNAWASLLSRAYVDMKGASHS